MRVHEELTEELEEARVRFSKAKQAECEANRAYDASLRHLSNCMQESRKLAFEYEASRSKLMLYNKLREEEQNDTGESEGSRQLHPEQQGYGQDNFRQELDASVQGSFSVQEVQTAHRP